MCSKNLGLDDAFADLGASVRCPFPSPCPAAQPLAESRALRGLSETAGTALKPSGQDLSSPCTNSETKLLCCTEETFKAHCKPQH